MVKMGRELELEGARAAGAKLIKEAGELASGAGAAMPRKLAPRKLTSKQTLSAVAPPFAEQYGFPGHEEAREFKPPQTKAHAAGMQPRRKGMRHAPAPGAMHRMPAKNSPVHHPARTMGGMRRPAAPRFGRNRRPMFSGLNRREAPHFGNRHMHLQTHSYEPNANAGMPDDDWEDNWGAYAPYPDNADWENDWNDEDWEDESEEEQAAEATEGYPHHQRVATGAPAAYDGQWGSQFYRNAGGNEQAMKKAGVNYDDYPLDVYRSIPYFPYDPSAATQMEQNQKIRAGKKLNMPHTQTAGANVGGANMAAGWGTWIGGGKAEDNMRHANIKLDHDPLHFRSAFPNPAWDKSEYDQGRHIAKRPAKDAWEAVHNHRMSQVPLESKGVSVNGFPIDKPQHRVYNQVDGLLDTLVATEDTPKYRDHGVAQQEKPMHFLLDENINGKPESQADGINKVFQSGDLDKVRQNAEDREQGIELHPDRPVSFDVPEEESPLEGAEEEPEEEAPQDDYDYDTDWSQGQWVWRGSDEDGDWEWEEAGQPEPQSNEGQPESWGEEADQQWQDTNSWKGEQQWNGINPQLAHQQTSYRHPSAGRRVSALPRQQPGYNPAVWK